MTPDPAAIAAQALTELGETPGDDPAAQLRHLVADLKQQTDVLSDAMLYNGELPDPDTWTTLRDRHLTALLAAVNVEHAAGAAAIDELIGPYGTTGDGDDR